MKEDIKFVIKCIVCFITIVIMTIFFGAVDSIQSNEMLLIGAIVVIILLYICAKICEW